MSDSPWVREYLVVIATHHSLITKEVNCLVLDAAWKLCVIFDVVEAVSFIPAGGEDVERDLAANGVSI
jgi:hypothetical protein